MSAIKYGLNDKVALVTGGSRGIGLDVARSLLAEGAKVIICARKKEGLEAAAQELGSEDFLAISCHIAQEDQVNDMFEVIEDRFGGLDILVNNVGMNLMTSSLADTEPGMWAKIIDSNLNGTFLVSRRGAQLMKKSGGGKIVTISSTAARTVAPAMGIYGIAKAALEQMTRVMAAELAGDNIQANAVAPGMVKTGFSQPFWSSKEIHDTLVAKIPAGRLAETVDVVQPVLFLASSGSDYITGQTILVDGGASVV